MAALRTVSVLAGLILFFCGFLINTPAAQELFYDDFSGDLSNWQELGNPGNPVITDGKLSLAWGYAPNWFMTNDTFNFGSEALRVDMTFAGGGHQETQNYKRILMEPLFGATSPEVEGGAVRATFNYTDFSLHRYVQNAEGDLVWQRIPLADDQSPYVPGTQIKVVVNPDGKTGTFYINDMEVAQFIWHGDPFEGGVGFRSVVQRNSKIDNFRLSQIDADGNETVILEDDFDREEVGEEWIAEPLAIEAPEGSITASIENGAFAIVNHPPAEAGNIDSWVRTAASISFEGNTTVIEYDFVDYIGDVVWAPSLVVGTRPFVAGETSGVMLIDSQTAPSFNYGMVAGAWTGGQAVALGGIQDGMRFRIEVDAGAQSGRCYRDDVLVSTWYVLGPAISGGMAFRSIVDRDAIIDDLLIYTVDENGTETIFLDENFNRDELGEDWIVESLTPNGLVEALYVELYDADNDGDNELYLDHDETLEDNWLRLDQEIPFGDQMVIIEGTYVEMPNGVPAIAIGTEQWIANQTVGPLLLDSIQTPWMMDTRGGNTWIGNGPFANTKISITINADGRSGVFHANDIAIREWEFAEGEAPIPAGAIGLNDPWSTPLQNHETYEGPSTVTAEYDDIRVTRISDTAVDRWMIFSR
ncbi:MAG: hypothetical protein ACOX5R_06085 [bacterium]